MKWISVFDRLPEYTGEYICAKYGNAQGAALVYFDTNEDDLSDNSFPAWTDHPEIVNCGHNTYHNLTKDDIERRAVHGRVTHWMELSDMPEQESTHEFYEKWISRND